MMKSYPAGMLMLLALAGCASDPEAETEIDAPDALPRDSSVAGGAEFDAAVPAADAATRGEDATTDEEAGAVAQPGDAAPDGDDASVEPEPDASPARVDAAPEAPDAEIAEQDAEIAEQDAEIAEQDARVADADLVDGPDAGPEIDGGADGVELDPAPDGPIQGGLGGQLFRDACPAGQVVIGLEGTAQQWVRSARIRCGVLQPDGAIRPADFVPAIGRRGLDIGAVWSRDCPADSVVVGLRLRTGLLVDQIVVRCAAVGPALELGAPVELEPAGGAGGDPLGAADCAPGAVAVGGNIRAGDSVDGIGLQCGVPR